VALGTEALNSLVSIARYIMRSSRRIFCTFASDQKDVTIYLTVQNVAHGFLHLSESKDERYLCTRSVIRCLIQKLKAHSKKSVETKVARRIASCPTGGQCTPGHLLCLRELRFACWSYSRHFPLVSPVVLLAYLLVHSAIRKYSSSASFLGRSFYLFLSEIRMQLI
jgi:hypothetical protein